MRSVPRRTCRRTTFSTSDSSIGYGSVPRTVTLRWRLFTARTSTDAVRVSVWERASPKPVMLSNTRPTFRGLTRTGGGSTALGDLRLVGLLGDVVLDDLHVDHDEQDPHGGHVERHLDERVGGAGPER